MWNRQREAQAARETLALAGEAGSAPNRNPPAVQDEITEAPARERPRTPLDAVEMK
jgi:ATP-binding cassette subfamily B protein